MNDNELIMGLHQTFQKSKMNGEHIEILSKSIEKTVNMIMDLSAVVEKINNRLMVVENNTATGVVDLGGWMACDCAASVCICGAFEHNMAINPEQAKKSFPGNFKTP